MQYTCVHTLPLRPLFLKGLFLLLFFLSAGWLLASMSTVHAATHDGIDVQTVPHTCFDDPKATLCDDADPLVANCVQDVRSIESVRAIHQGIWVGDVDLRYSPHCRSFWLRIVGFAGSSLLRVSVTAQFAGHPAQMGDCLASATQPAACLFDPDGGISTFTTMAFERRPLASSFGTFVFTDGTSMQVSLLS
jgi:Protein of unknown function (DUF2690)